MTPEEYASQSTTGDDRENVGVEVDSHGEGVQRNPVETKDDGHSDH